MGPKATQRLAQRETFGHLQTALDCYGAEGDHFLERIVTVDETWTHHYEQESKHQSIDWKHRHSPTKKKFKTHSTAGKLMFLEHYQEIGYTMNSVHYSVMSQSLQFETNEEDYCQKALCCCMTMPILILLPTLLKPLRN